MSGTNKENCIYTMSVLFCYYVTVYYQQLPPKYSNNIHDNIPFHIHHGLFLFFQYKDSRGWVDDVTHTRLFMLVNLFSFYFFAIIKG